LEESSGGEKNAKGHLSGRSLLRKGSALSLLTFASRLLGLLREMTKASFLGTSALADAFAVSFMLPNLFRRLFAEGSIAVAFIPTFKGYLLEGDRKTIKEFLSCFLTFLTFFVTLAVIAGILAAPAVVRIFGMEEHAEAVFLTRFMFPFLAFISIAALFQGILNSHNIFAPTGMAPILLNVVTILCAFALSPFTENPARAMAIGVIVGGFLGAAIQLPFVLKQGHRFFFVGLKRAFDNPGTRKVLRLIAPTVIGMAAYQVNDLVSVALASNAGEGVVSSLQYSLRLQELLLGVFAVSIGTVLLPSLASLAKSSQWDIYNQRLASAINIIALITIPVTFFSLMQGENLIRLLFQSNNFDETSVRLTLTAFTFHMPGLFFIAANRILAPAFYAQSDAKSPTFAGIVSFAVNIALAAILVGPFSGAGIALALSVASAVNTVVLIVFLKKKPNAASAPLAISPSFFYMLKMVLFSLLACIPVYFLSPLLTDFFAGRARIVSHGAPLAICFLVFTAAGLALLAFTKDKQLRAFVSMLRGKR